MLFDRSFVYPSDEIGPYIELYGIVESVGDTTGEDVSVTVSTDKGKFVGYYLSKHAPPIGSRASIRVYDAGGGFYPDNKITGWSSVCSVQADKKKPCGTVSWKEHYEAYASYSKKYGKSQSADRIAERGGFSYGELVLFLGREPETWKPIS